MSAYQGIRNVILSGFFTHVLNEWSLVLLSLEQTEVWKQAGE